MSQNSVKYVDNKARNIIGSASILQIEEEGRKPKAFLVAHKSAQATKTGYLCLRVSKTGIVDTDNPVVLIDNQKSQSAIISQASKASGPVAEAHQAKINQFLATSKNPVVNAYKDVFVPAEQKSGHNQTRDYGRFTTSLQSDFIGARVNESDRHNAENARLRSEAQTHDGPA